mgnify:CR=1 FL=1
MNKVHLILFCVTMGLMLFSAGAAADNPSVSTTSFDGVTISSCTLYGNLQKNGGYDVTDVGFLYGTSASNLGYAVSEGFRGHSYGRYSSTINGLEAGTTYYFRAYAVNEQGTSYGPIMSFTTPSGKPGPFNISAPYQNHAVNADNGVNAQWSSAPGAEGYRVTLRDMTMNIVCFANRETGSSTSYAIPQENFIPGHEYSLSICAYSDAGETCQEQRFSIQQMSGVTVIPTNSTGLPNQNTNQYRNSRILELIAAGEELPLQENGTQGMPMYRYTFTVRTNTDVGQVCLFLHNGTSTRLAGVNSTYNTNGFLTQTREFTFTQNLSYEEWQNLRAEACVYYDGQPIRDREGAYKEIPVPAPGEGNAQVFGSTNQFMEQIMSFVRNMFSWNFRGASAE